MEKFSFRVSSANFAEGTITVIYTPDRVGLTDHIKKVHVPESVLANAGENIMDDLRAIVIKAAPQNRWETEKRVKEIPVVSQILPRMHEDWPAVTLTEIQEVMGED
jgi:hypothetical protein